VSYGLNPHGNYAVAFNRFLNATTFVQTDTAQNQAVSANFRVRYAFHPDRDLYVIYNVGNRFQSLVAGNPMQLGEQKFARRLLIRGRGDPDLDYQDRHYAFALSIPTTLSKSSSDAYSITILPLPFRSLIRTRTPKACSISLCTALTFGSCHRAARAGADCG